MAISNREQLHLFLSTLCNHVYYQPPENIQMTYPAIVYNRSKINNTAADNLVYLQGVSYSITVIDKNPDSEIVYNLSLLPTIRHDRHFATNGLNHDVFILNFNK